MSAELRLEDSGKSLHQVGEMGTGGGRLGFPQGRGPMSGTRATYKGFKNK
jgi:hypothetical protein